jgi:hypothetical protein
MRRHRDARLNVSNAYQGLLVRAYCLGRFSKDRYGAGRCPKTRELEEFLPRGRSPPGMTIGRLAILVQLNSRPEIHPMGIIRPRGLTFSPV